jgi:putative oxidoreductase
MERPMNAWLSLAGRLLLASIFIISGLNKAVSPAQTAEAMQAVGLSPLLLWPTIALEVIGGIALAVGWFSRPAAFLLAAFTILAGLFFHTDFADMNQMNHFMKNIALAGGLLMLTANGPGRISLSSRFFTVPHGREPLAYR